MSTDISQSADSYYIVAGCKPWNRQVFDERISCLPGRWRYVECPEELTPELLQALNPRYVFFLHWSWLVPESVFNAVECVCFHMTDVPYGRGGSPLQNLIVRGHRETKLTALRMSAVLDAGPVYLRRPLSLEGNAEEIFIRASQLSAAMIATLITQEVIPQPQSGEPTLFKRRRPADSVIPELPGLDRLHDFIRMLDADGYPRAFIEHQGFRYEFSRAVRYDGRIAADVKITPIADIKKADATPPKEI